MELEVVHPGVRALLLEHIETHEQLAVVLLLRSDRRLSWTNLTLAEKLKIPEGMAEETLRHLASHGLVAQDGHESVQYRYAPGTPELGESVDHLADAYQTHWLDIMKLMSENAIVRVRTTVIDTFADAFIVPPPKKGRNQDG